MAALLVALPPCSSPHGPGVTVTLLTLNWPRDAMACAVVIQSPRVPVGSVPCLPFWPYPFDLVSLFETPELDSVSSGN